MLEKQNPNSFERFDKTILFEGSIVRSGEGKTRFLDLAVYSYIYFFVSQKSVLTYGNLQIIMRKFLVGKNEQFQHRL